MVKFKESIYLDTSIPSAYFDEREVLRMELTQKWWNSEIPKYNVYISILTIEEIKRTKGIKREKMLKLINNIEILRINEEIESVANGYVKQGIVSAKYLPDAFQCAFASIYKIDYLVTWNIGHLAGVHKQRAFRLFNVSAGLFVPMIVTPDFFEEEEG